MPCLDGTYSCWSNNKSSPTLQEDLRLFITSSYNVAKNWNLLLDIFEIKADHHGARPHPLDRRSTTD